MRITFFLLCSLTFSLLQAQTQSSASAPHASIAVQITPDQFGGLVEVFLKPKISSWVSFGYNRSSSQLGFGTDTTISEFFILPAETVTYENLQTQINIRAGVRFYIPTSKDKWSIWYSPVIGFTNLTAPSEEYLLAYRRADLHFSSERIGFRRAEQNIELGGELGLRFSFWKSFYLEGSAFIIGERSILDKNRNQQVVGIDTHLALGITF